MAILSPIMSELGAETETDDGNMFDCLEGGEINEETDDEAEQ